MKITLHLNGSVAALAAVLEFISSEGLDVGESLSPAPITAAPINTSVLIPAENFVVTNGQPSQPQMQPIPPATPVTTETPVFDHTGMPWDARIHSSNKTTKADGSWTKRRGVDDATFQAVEAELRAKHPASAPQPIAQPVPLAPVPMPQHQQAAPVAPTSPVPVSAPVAPVPMASMAGAAAPAPNNPIPPNMAQPAVPAGPPSTLNDFMIRLAPLMDASQGGTVTSEYLTTIIGQVNQAWGPHLGGRVLNSIADLAAFPQLQIIPWIWQVFQRDGKAA